MALLGLLGLPGVLFIPLLLRWVGTEVMANVLVMQVYVYYLTLLVQFGFNWSGPASLGRLSDPEARLTVLKNSIATKLLLFVLPATLVFVLIMAKMWGQAGGYLGLFWVALLGFAFNSNWFLQSQGRFRTGVGLAASGLALAVGILSVLFAIRNLELSIAAYLAVLALILPQFCLGVGSWWSSSKETIIPVEAPKKTWGHVQALLASGWVLVLSQIFLQASTTLGTIVVHEIASTDVTAAYAATEKFFNLGATFLVAIYTAAYPKLAEQYHQNRPRYWRNLSLLGAGIFSLGILAALFMGVFGDWLFEIYLGPQLSMLVAPILVAFGLWLSLAVFQHMASSHLVLKGRNSHALFLNLVVLCLVVALGWIFARYQPVFWVYGALLAQVLPLMLLVKLYWSDQRSAVV